MANSSPLWRRIAPGLLGCAALLPLPSRAIAPRAEYPTLRALLIGGGPEKSYNQVAIESNMRYVGNLLPMETPRTVLFADGDPNSATVLYTEDPRLLSVGERLARLLVLERDAPDTNPSHYKKPNLNAKLDGPTQRRSIARAFAQIAEETEAKPGRSLFLYFTGHGSNNQKNDENNFFDLWGGDQLAVRELAKQIERLPEETPLAVVMVSCHSGAFANLLHEGGDPDAPVTKRDIAGFFAAIKERVAAGCTSAVNEAEYRDFTSYFFAALTGRDRIGRRVTGADYNNDGRVSMEEAYCYTLANDRSVDVPVCTSDVFLRRFVKMTDQEVFQTRYSDVRRWATPGQRAALDALATYLNRTSGEDRLAKAYEAVRNGQFREGVSNEKYRESARRFRRLREEGRRQLFRRFPDLQTRKTERFDALMKEAAVYLSKQAEAGQWKDLLEADDALYQTDTAEEQTEVAESHLIRFVRLGKSIVLTHQLRRGRDEERKARFERLVAAEGRTLLPPAPVQNAALD